MVDLLAIFKKRRMLEALFILSFLLSAPCTATAFSRTDYIIVHTSELGRDLTLKVVSKGNVFAVDGAPTAATPIMSSPATGEPIGFWTNAGLPIMPGAACVMARPI